MSEYDRHFLVQKYGLLLQNVLVEIRNLSLEEGNSKRINDLAELTHNVPELLICSNDYVLDYLREGFIEYARKYHPEIDPQKSRFVMLMDMDESTFNALYLRHSSPEPVEVAG